MAVYYNILFIANNATAFSSTVVEVVIIRELQKKALK